MPLDLLGAVVIAVPSALIAWRLRVVTAGGAAAGAVCAIAIYLGTYLAGIAVLGMALLLTALSSRVGSARKRSSGIAEDLEGGRGAANVIANCGVAAAGSLLTITSPAFAGDAGAVLVVAALTAGASDTVASEIGKALSARARSFPTFRVVAAGTPGAVSAAGTLAGVVAAVVIAWPAVTFWLLAREHLFVIVVACTTAAFVESAMATWLERRGIVGNHALNVINTMVAAGLAAAWVAR